MKAAFIFENVKWIGKHSKSITLLASERRKEIVGLCAISFCLFLAGECEHNTLHWHLSAFSLKKIRFLLILLSKNYMRSARGSSCVAHCIMVFVVLFPPTDDATIKRSVACANWKFTFGEFDDKHEFGAPQGEPITIGGLWSDQNIKSGRRCTFGKRINTSWPLTIFIYSFFTTQQSRRDKNGKIN